MRIHRVNASQVQPVVTSQDLADGAPTLRGADRLRAALGLATLVMLGLSWPLWVPTEAFPRIPFVFGLPELPVAVSWALFASVLGAIAAATLGIAWRGMLGLSLVLLTLLILQDQHRFQPWVYQYLMVGLILATLPGGQRWTYVRWWFVGLYLYSGLSKLDVSFCREMGVQFLRTAVRPLGLAPDSWSPVGRVAAVLIMPAWEIAAALALAWPASRRIGLSAAVVLHAALLYVLGPWGLRQSTIVLVWNVAMIIEVGIVFGPDRPEPTTPHEPQSRLALLTRAWFWIAMVLPLGERWGLWDAWPSHALYASHVERTHVLVHEDERAALPAEVHRHLRAVDTGPWLALDLTAWSRAVRGVPVYPAARTSNGLAEALAARYGGLRLLRVIHWGRAGLWTDRRTRVVCLGRDAIRRQGNRYWLNAHPDVASRVIEKPTRPDRP